VRDHLERISFTERMFWIAVEACRLL